MADDFVLDKYEADAWEGDAGLANTDPSNFTFDTPANVGGWDLNTGVAGATVKPLDEMMPSEGTRVNQASEGTQLLGADGFTALMDSGDVKGLTNANNNFASNAVGSVKGAAEDQFGPSRGPYPGANQGFIFNQAWGTVPGPRAAYTDPANADALHMALEKGVDSSVYLWAAQGNQTGTTPAVDPNEEIWSGDGNMSHGAVQAEQAKGLMQGGQNPFDRILTGDVYDSVWGNDPNDGTWTHQEILNAQAKALASGGQNWYDHAMTGDIFSGYRDSTTGKITYSPQDAQEIARKMAMYNADRARFGQGGYGNVRNSLWEFNQPGSGFEVDTYGLSDESAQAAEAGAMQGGPSGLQRIKRIMGSF